MANILIVDDDGELALAVAERLHSAGHSCLVERTGTAALEAVGQHPFDLVVLDIMLPEISGFEVCRRIRKDPKLYTLPILVLSAMDSEEEVRHGLAQGADDYVTKPFEMIRLIERIEALLEAAPQFSALDSVTDLPGSRLIRRELQRCVASQINFDLAYVELTSIREFTAAGATNSARNKAVRLLADLLKKNGTDFKNAPFAVGHMGGGHFVCIVPLDQARKYCENVRNEWLAQLQRFYDAAGRGQVYREKMANPESKRPPLLDVRFLITQYDQHSLLTSTDLFDMLSKMRARALATSTGGVFQDQRTSSK